MDLTRNLCVCFCVLIRECVCVCVLGVCVPVVDRGGGTLRYPRSGPSSSINIYNLERRGHVCVHACAGVCVCVLTLLLLCEAMRGL